MFYLTAKFQKKVMNGFRENAWRTDERTDERTYEHDSLGLQRLRRETKNQTIPVNQSEEKLEKPNF